MKHPAKRPTSISRWGNRGACGAVAGLALWLAACADEPLAEPAPAPGARAAPIVFDSPPPPPLGTVPVPEPSNLSAFVKDRAAAIALGKALFWDMQVGSDGVQACASCHFHAGADNRFKNQVNPGLLRVGSDGEPDPDFYTDRGHNRVLTPADFPLRKLADPDDRRSQVLRDSNDVVSSQAIAHRGHGAAEGKRAAKDEPGKGGIVGETARELDPQGFYVRGVNVRRVEPRNAPSVINAVFNHRNYWDGRAQATFNGVNVWGDRDPHARVYRADRPGAEPVAVAVRIDNASLASQAMGPPLSTLEMSFDGRTFVELGAALTGPAGHGRRPHLRDVGRKLASKRPLAGQIVDPTDSVLGPLSRAPRPGLTVSSYDKLIKEAFHDVWWRPGHRIRIDDDGARGVCKGCDGEARAYTLMEYNFSLFFGLAIQLYEATLVSDDTPYDRWAAGDRAALDDAQVRGLALFLGRTGTRCINCHGGPELTNASVAFVRANRLRRREGNVIDMGYNNIGVRPILEDLGLGGRDPFGGPLSEARLAFDGAIVDPALQPPLAPGADTLGADGAFKTPGLRNVELTGPYFHNGGAATLRQVIDFYSRGGDFQPIVARAGNVIAPIHTINLSEAQKEDLVAFLRALTDERVRHRRAPFDHPQLFVPHGHPGDEERVVDDGAGVATDTLEEIPATGRAGASRPLRGFLEAPR